MLGLTLSASFLAGRVGAQAPHPWQCLACRRRRGGRPGGRQVPPPLQPQGWPQGRLVRSGQRGKRGPNECCRGPTWLAARDGAGEDGQLGDRGTPVSPTLPPRSVLIRRGGLFLPQVLPWSSSRVLSQPPGRRRGDAGAGARARARGARACTWAGRGDACGRGHTGGRESATPVRPQASTTGPHPARSPSPLPAHAIKCSLPPACRTHHRRCRPSRPASGTGGGLCSTAAAPPLGPRSGRQSARPAGRSWRRWGSLAGEAGQGLGAPLAACPARHPVQHPESLHSPPGIGYQLIPTSRLATRSPAGRGATV